MAKRKAASDKLISAVWEGVTITAFSAYRSDVTVHEQLFFELKFKQPLTGFPFRPGIDDPERFNEKPITLNFQTSSGAIEQVVANIVKVVYIKSQAQQAEIIIGGTMYRPAKKIPKFSLLAIALFMLPVVFLGGLFLYANSLERQLIEKQGKIIFFKDDSYKKHKRYTFKVSPYNATLYREYYRHIFKTPPENMADLFTSDYDGFHRDSTGQAVRFYLFKHDCNKLYKSGQKITFFNLKGIDQPSSRTDHFLDLLNYAADQTWVYFAWLLLLVTEVFCFVCAYYYYKMYSLFHHGGNKFLWYTCLGLSFMINFGIIMTIA